MSARGTVTRGKVELASVGPRTLLQVTGLDNETFSNVELLLPPGYVANPTQGDVLILKANDTRDHKVAVAGDFTGDTVADLQPGEIGLSRGGRMVILRNRWTEIVDPAEIRLVAPLLHWSPDGVTFYTLATNQHTHPDVAAGTANTGLPNATTGALT